MARDDDSELRDLLREWVVADAPAHLDNRILVRHMTWWRFLLQGSIRVPVPIGILAATMLVVLSSLLLRADRPLAAPDGISGAFSLTEFQPVGNVGVRIIGGDDAR
jgi:hypothetical protein